MTIAQEIIDILTANQFSVAVNQRNEHVFTKRITGFAEAGSISDGTRIVTLQIDESGRWFERVDGWGKVERDVDLRRFTDAQEAIKAVLA